MSEFPLLDAVAAEEPGTTLTEAAMSVLLCGKAGLVEEGFADDETGAEALLGECRAFTEGVA